ncbi:MAG TPA: hypothetical protein VE913_22800 [Longimicrobium sp.]|nr:hypothetical protein [Longimicrobium sp.]
MQQYLRAILLAVPILAATACGDGVTEVPAVEEEREHNVTGIWQSDFRGTAIYEFTWRQADTVVTGAVDAITPFVSYVQGTPIPAYPRIRYSASGSNDGENRINVMLGEPGQFTMTYSGVVANDSTIIGTLTVPAPGVTRSYRMPLVRVAEPFPLRPPPLTNTSAREAMVAP